MNEQNLILKKAKYLMDKNIMTYIKTKKSLFYNGYIRKIDYPDHILFEDRFLGDIPIYFEEIENIEPHKVRSVKE